MTIGIAVPALGGIVVATDSRTSGGEIYFDGAAKLHTLGKYTLLATSGDEILLMGMQEALTAKEPPPTFAAARELLRDISSEVHDAHSRLRQGNEPPLDAALIIAGCDDDGRPLCCLAQRQNSFAPVRWTGDRCLSIGHDIPVLPILKRLWKPSMDMERAKRLAAMAIVEACHVGTRVGLPMQIGVVTADGACVLSSEEADALAKWAEQADWGRILD